MSDRNPLSEGKAKAILDGILKHVEDKRGKKVSEWTARYTLVDGVKIFKHDWASLMKANFAGNPVSPVSNTRDVPRIKRNVVTPLRDAGLTVTEFLRFIFDNWVLLRSSPQFRKFQTYPPVPALAWFLKFADLYISAFMDYKNSNNTVFEEPERQRREQRVEQKKEVLSKVVRVARDEIKKREQEIARLKAENKSLRSQKLSRITRGAAKPANKLPDWE
jgi:hypothetical protein